MIGLEKSHPNHCKRLMRYYGFKSVGSGSLYNEYQCDKCNETVFKKVEFRK